jgi:hypothetical protein
LRGNGVGSDYRHSAAAGLNKPNISIPSDEFPADIGDMPQLNLAVELPQKWSVTTEESEPGGLWPFVHC